MMKIEDIVDDIVLLVLTEHEPLKELGIEKNKLFAKIVGYDENGTWIQHPNFKMPDNSTSDRKKMMSVNAAVLIPWIYIASIVHFPNVEGYDFPNPFETKVGFDIE